MRKYGLTLLATCIITYMSLTTGHGVVVIHLPFAHADKLVHFLMYLVLSLVLTFDLTRAQVRRPLLLAVALLFPVAYGGLMEYMQQYFPPRTADWQDFLANTLGALSVFVVNLIRLCRKRLS